MKTVLFLVLTAFTLFIATTSNADVISPTNDNTAFRVVLIGPEADFIPFTIQYRGQPLALNTPMVVDLGKCVDFNLTTLEAGIQFLPMQFCGSFKKGAITDIPIYGIRLSSKKPYADGVFGDLILNLSIQNMQKNLIQYTSRLTSFEQLKLVPIISDELNLRTSLSYASAPLGIDPKSGTAEYILDTEPLAEIKIKRMHKKVFPDAQQGQIHMLRRPKWNYASEQNLYLNTPEVAELDVKMLLMPWPESDDLYLNFKSGSMELSITPPAGPYQTGTGKRQLPAIDQVRSDYPTEILIYRIDVDDIKVNDANGNSKTVHGTYSVNRQVMEYSTLLTRNAPTQTGVDVPGGKYKVVVSYKDPFTQTDETKTYELNF